MLKEERELELKRIREAELEAKGLVGVAYDIKVKRMKEECRWCFKELCREAASPTFDFNACLHRLREKLSIYTIRLEAVGTDEEELEKLRRWREKRLRIRRKAKKRK